MSLPLNPGRNQPQQAPRGTTDFEDKNSASEAQFAELVTRFRAETGGSLSAAHSAELALDIVLNGIASHACRATAASGAAILLRRDQNLLCRATSGPLAPNLGESVSLSSGISAQCLQTRRVVSCDDVLFDPRADVQASAGLGIRAILATPLLRGEETLGVFELFASLPHSFSTRDEATLGLLAGDVLRNLELESGFRQRPTYASRSAPPSTGNPGPGDEISTVARFDLLTAMLSGCVVACTILLAFLTVHHFVIHGPPAGMQRVQVSQSPGSEAPGRVRSANANVASNATAEAEAVDERTSMAHVPRRDTKYPLPPGALVVTQNGREIFRSSPAEQTDSVLKDPTEPQNAGASVEGAQARVLRLIQPTYPEEARRKGIFGAVVLDVTVAADGTVQDVKVVSADPLLAEASVAAVRQWQFRVNRINGNLTDAQTRVTVNFRLPRR